MNFMASWMIWAGLGVASIPIIIHLLNRRRFIRVDWAPMKYLKLTIKTNRRRLQLEQLILLAIRAIALILLFVALARPIVSNTGLGAWLGGKSRKARVVVIDDSVSMVASDQKATAFDRAKNAAMEIVRQTSPGDQLTVFVTSKPKQPLSRNSQLDEPADLVQAISRLAPTDTMSQWASTLKTVHDYLREAAYPIHEVILITDLQEAGWNDDVPDVVRKLSGSEVSCKIIDVGRQLQANVTIKQMSQTTPVALVGTRVDLEAIVENHGGEKIGGLQATLHFDNQTRSIDLPDLPPHTEAKIALSIRPSQPGLQRVRFELPADSLERDNQRFFVVDVRSAIEVQLVDGDPKPSAFLSETFFLEASFVSGSAPWNVTKIQDGDFTSDRDVPDVKVLANVGSIDETAVRRLEQQVRGGMGLIIYAGDLIDTELYNRLMYKDGKGLLPAKLSADDGSVDVEIAGLSVAGLDDSPLAALVRLAPEVLSRVRPTRIAPVEISESDQNVRVLAHWNDSEQKPALLERRFGDGTVYFWTITADREWSNWPQQPSFVLAMRNAVQSAAAQSATNSHSLAGEPIVAELEATNLPDGAKIALPGGSEPISLTVDTATDPPVLRHSDTMSAGFYPIHWLTPQGQEQTRLFGVNVDARECTDQRLGETELTNLLPELSWTLVHLGSRDESSVARVEMWRPIMYGFLALIGIESIFAAWVSRER
ncbi:MAG: hypothetical protein ACI9HK_001026 [Pirellulaceae bacterium]|jgi:hypothetical protein